MTKLRRDALGVLRAGLAAIGTREAIRRQCVLKGSRLTVREHSFDLSAFRRLYVIGFGKASLETAQELELILGDRITDGIVLDVKRARLKRIKSVKGTHPFPSEANRIATGDIMALVRQADSRDLIITIISGGGSALLCQPYKLSCDDLTLMTRTLMRAGATIEETNTVRKHLSEIQGGQFARLAHPATVLGLVFSDVPGDDIGVIASGPTVMDTTTVADARRVMRKYDVLKACRLPTCQLRETPKDPAFFRDVTNVFLMNNAYAVAAMETEARRRGYKTRVYSTSLTGEAREVGRLLAGLPRSGEMVFAAGETTVSVLGNGKGGRNQEVALGALGSVDDDALVIACASDGIDNTPAAGAIADKETRKHAKDLRLSADKALAKNASYAFFKKSGDHIVTGVTGANVSDLFIAARR